jgi:monovalent cation/hydrogen antiporter
MDRPGPWYNCEIVGTGIHGIEITLLALVTLVAGLAALAQRLKTPYPIVLLLGGLGLSFFRAVPHVSLNPDLVFLVVLPPLLFASALNTSWREFRFNLVSILMLGIGLVGFTVAGVAVVAHFFIREFDWRVGAVLGAVISTTDAIAVGAIARRVNLPSYLLDLIEGESLINDATGLLALQFATALVVSGEIPSISHGLYEFLWLITGGIACGLFVAVIIAWFDRRITTTALQMMVSLATPYFAYLLGESIHSSGVLAAVACGLYLGRTRSETFSTEGRLESQAVWKTVDFVINSLVFIIIGLQLPAILRGVHPQYWHRLIGGAAFICAVVIGLRMFWVFPGGYISYLIRYRLLKQHVQPLNSRSLVVIGWSGMRGVLTLAAALSLPVVTANGEPFPYRAGLIFLAFAVILVTLVGQGLTLPTLMRRLGVCEGPGQRQSERAARKLLLQSALDKLQSMKLPEDEGTREAASLLEREYQQRLQGVEDEDVEEDTIDVDRKYQELAFRLRQVERQELVQLREHDLVHDSILRELEKDLDLADLRWRKEVQE